uniref:Uncharacterized protein n=1 Tax=Rhizophora mucronata TaxID=61149 RepID=A0A2P2NAB7_RHIMU
MIVHKMQLLELSLCISISCLAFYLNFLCGTCLFFCIC